MTDKVSVHNARGKSAISQKTRPEITGPRTAGMRHYRLEQRPRGLDRKEANRRVRAFYRFTRLVAGSGYDIDSIAQAVAQLSAESIGDLSIVTLLNMHHDRYHIAAFHDGDPAAAAAVREALSIASEFSRDEGVVARVIRSGQPVLIPHMDMQELLAVAPPAFRTYIHTIGIDSVLVVPMVGRSGMVGAISLSRHRGGKALTATDQAFALEIGYRAALAIENATLVQSLRTEVSARLFAKEALAASEERFRSIFASTTLGLTIMDLVGTILESNSAFQEMTGYSETELIAARFEDLIHPEDVIAALKTFTDLKTSSEPHARVEQRLIRQDGSAIWARTTFAGVKKGAGDDTLALIVGITENVTETKEAEAEIQELKVHLQRSIEVERLQLARHLHDVPLQELYAVIYKLEELRRNADAGTSKTLQEVVGDINATLSALRATASELRPPALSRFGLEKAIRSYVSDLRHNHPEIQFKLSLAKDHLALSENMRLALFRVFQSAVGNVLRHANATEIEVRFSFDAEEARLEISDNGHGFAVPSNWMSYVRDGRYGLAGISEQVTAVGGTLTIDSKPDAPTTVRAVIPC